MDAGPARVEYHLDVGTDPNFTPTTFASCFTSQTTYAAGYEGDDPCMPSQGQLYYWRVKALDDPRGVEGIYSDADPVAPDNQDYKFVYSAGVGQPAEPGQRRHRTSPCRRCAGPRARTPSSTTSSIYGNTDTSEFTGVVTTALSWTPGGGPRPGQRAVLLERHGHRLRRQALALWTRAGPSTSAPRLPPARRRSRRRPPSRSRRGSRSCSWTPVTGASTTSCACPRRRGSRCRRAPPTCWAAGFEYPSVTDDDTYFLQARHLHLVDRGLRRRRRQRRRGSAPRRSRSSSRPWSAAGVWPWTARLLDDHTWCTAQLSFGGALCDNVPATPVLDWAPVIGAGGYLVYLAQDADFTNRVLDPYALTSNSRWTPTVEELTALADNQSGPAYYWFIRPCVSIRPIINCGPDPISPDGAATNAFRKVSPKVVQTAPADNSTQTRHPGHLQLAGLPHDQRRGHLHRWGRAVAPVRSPLPDPGVPVRHHPGRERHRRHHRRPDDLHGVHRHLPGGRPVLAGPGPRRQGNRLAWSDTRKFTKVTPATILNPADGTVDPGAFPAFNSHLSSGEFPFRWTSNPYDVTWKIEVYKDDDTTLSSGKRVFSTTSKQAAFVPPASLPPSTLPYRWRIIRYDATGDENKGRWSDLGRFWVDPAPVTLVSPSSGSTSAPERRRAEVGPVLGGRAAGRGVLRRHPQREQLERGLGLRDLRERLGADRELPGRHLQLGRSRRSTPAATSWAPARPGPSSVNTGRLSARAGHARSRHPDGPEVGKHVHEHRCRRGTSRAPVTRNTYQWLRNGSTISGGNRPDVRDNPRATWPSRSPCA